MTWFLLVYLVVYGGIQAYFFVKVRIAFPRLGHWSIALGAFLLLMLAAPLASRWLEHAGLVHVPRVLSTVGYIWAAISFWFFLLFLASDVWNLGVWLAAKKLPAAAGIALPARPTFLAFATLAAIGTVYGLYGASNIRIKEFTFRTPRLPAGSAPIRLVQISDVHLDLVVGQGRLEKIARLIEQARPDILVSTGDLVDSSLDRAQALSAVLRAVHAPLGKFAVTGNHEFYAGLDKSLAFHEAAGFRMLRGESVVVADGRLRIAGVDDPGHAAVRSKLTDENMALPTADGREATILLKHRPTVAAEALGRFDLQLSGHVHGGQVFPFGYIVRLFFPLTPGFHRLEKNSALYVSYGTGTWGPPMRVCAPPEVTVITITPAEEAR